MRAVVDWSYGLLSEDEQLFFRALGIDPGFEVPIYRYRPWTDSTLGTIRPRDERRCGYRLEKMGTIDGDVVVAPGGRFGLYTMGAPVACRPSRTAQCQRDSPKGSGIMNLITHTILQQAQGLRSSRPNTPISMSLSMILDASP